MGPKNDRRRVRKIKVPTDTPTEFELGDTAADTHRREEGEQKERGRKRHRNRGRQKARRQETTYLAEEGVAEKHAKTDRSDTEMDTEGGEAGTSQLH